MGGPAAIRRRSLTGARYSVYMSNGRQNIRAWSIGLDMVYSAAGMLLLGALIDWAAGTRPWWMLGLGLLGLVVGVYRFIRDAMRMNTASSRKASGRARPGGSPDQRPDESD